MDRAKALLVEKNIKPTFQRIKILDYLLGHESHPTVDTIYTALANKVSTLSKTTIYNTLDLFKEKGLVDELTITGSELRYDYDIEPHHHFLCKECGAIINIDVQCSYLTEMIIEGNEIEEIHGYFKGVCKNCLEEKKQCNQ